MEPGLYTIARVGPPWRLSGAGWRYLGSSSPLRFDCYFLLAPFFVNFPPNLASIFRFGGRFSMILGVVRCWFVVCCCLCSLVSFFVWMLSESVDLVFLLVCSFVPVVVRSCVRSFVRLFVCFSVSSFVCSFVCFFVCLFCCSFKNVSLSLGR